MVLMMLAAAVWLVVLVLLIRIALRNLIPESTPKRYVVRSIDSAHTVRAFVERTKKDSANQPVTLNPRNRHERRASAKIARQLRKSGREVRVSGAEETF